MESKKKYGFRYRDDVLNTFCMLAFLTGGRRFYEIQIENFSGVFPSVRTIQKHLKKYDFSVLEGTLNVIGLKQFLILNNLPLTVCICEDATAILGRREYDSGTNSVMGFSLPMEPNRLRNANLAKVKTAEDIIHLFETLPRASFVVVVMAQPLADVPGLRICSFASDNRFTTEDVKARKATIAAALEAEGIVMLSFSADGDARELKMERQDLELGKKPPKSITFQPLPIKR